jgi:hypothetical protein
MRLGMRKEKVMRIHARIALITMLMIALTPLSIKATDGASTKPALNAATSWLSLIDNGKYLESWKAAAAYFRKSVDKEKWQQVMTGTRKYLGKRISREMQTTARRSEMKGAPTGTYLVIQYKTAFENKRSSIEIVTMMLEKDGKWRVSGYNIKFPA